MSTWSRVTSFLRKALGDVRGRAGGVLDDEFDLLAAEDVAILLEIGLHPGQNLAAVVREWPRKFGDDADLHGALRERRARADQAAMLQSRTPAPCASVASWFCSPRYGLLL